MRIRVLFAFPLAAGISLSWLFGCGGLEPPPVQRGNRSSPGPTTPQESPAVSRASQELGDRLNTLINDATVRFQPLDYEYDEDLLQILDRAEAYLAGKSTGPAPRSMPRLSEGEEMDHLRETFRRWTARTGKQLRAEIDPLKAEVAARKPGGPAFHPDFHKRFSVSFDDLIPIEVAEIRERRNRYIHEQANAILNPYREKDPDAVREFEQVLNQPPYNLTNPEPAADKKS